MYRRVIIQNKKSILLDVDEVICFPGFLQAINDFMGTDYVIDDFEDYYIDEVAIPKEIFDEFNNFINNINLYENAHVLPNAVPTIKLLNDYYNIYICQLALIPLILMAPVDCLKINTTF